MPLGTEACDAVVPGITNRNHLKKVVRIIGVHCADTGRGGQIWNLRAASILLDLGLFLSSRACSNSYHDRQMPTADFLKNTSQIWIWSQFIASFRPLESLVYSESKCAGSWTCLSQDPGRECTSRKIAQEGRAIKNARQRTNSRLILLRSKKLEKRKWITKKI